MKKIILLLLLSGLATAAFAQNYSAVEQQINQSVQANAAEFSRLSNLLKDTMNQRDLDNLVKAFNARQVEIKVLQEEIEEMISRPATKQAIEVKFNRLQESMRAEQRFIERLNNLRNN